MSATTVVVVFIREKPVSDSPLVGSQWEHIGRLSLPADSIPHMGDRVYVQWDLSNFISGSEVLGVNKHYTINGLTSVEVIVR